MIYFERSDLCYGKESNYRERIQKYNLLLASLPLIIP